MAKIYPLDCGPSISHYYTALYSGEHDHYSDICTRRLSGYMAKIGEKVVDTIRFDYTRASGWTWKRAHVLFLRELFRAIDMPDSITRQVTVPNLSNPKKGVVFHTRNHPGPVILLAHSLIRDLHEHPKKAWVAYFVWRKGFNILDAYNFASNNNPVVRRGGEVHWRWFDYSGSQAIPRTIRMLVPISEKAKGMVCYKITGKLSGGRAAGNEVMDLMRAYNNSGYPRELAAAVKNQVMASDGDKYIHHFLLSTQRG